MNLTMFLLIMFFIFLSMSFIMQLYQNKLMHNEDVVIVNKIVDVTPEEMEEII